MYFLFAFWVYLVEKSLVNRVAKPMLRQMGAIVANGICEVGVVLLTSQKTVMSRTLILRTLILCLI